MARCQKACNQTLRAAVNRPGDERRNSKRQEYARQGRNMRFSGEDGRATKKKKKQVVLAGRSCPDAAHALEDGRDTDRQLHISEGLGVGRGVNARGMFV